MIGTRPRIWLVGATIRPGGLPRYELAITWFKKAEVMRRRFEISISTGPRALPGSTSRIKTILYGLAVVSLICAALVIGITVGTTVAVTIGVLVVAALLLLAVRGVLGRIQIR